MIKTTPILFSLFLTLFISSCASTTEQGAIGLTRKQYMLGASSEEVNQMALQNYAQVKQEAASKKALDTNPEYVRRVQAIAKKIIPQAVVFRKDAPGWAWETHVITSPELNAYCMPGGKIVFYSGIIEKLKMTDGEIAAVMGHEVAHALREHGREQLARAKTQQLLLGTAVATGAVGQDKAQYLNIGAQLLYSLPHGRSQESEADEIGVELMARAGYDPREAVNLWVKMSSMGGGKPPAFLSTHPSDEKRIEDIQRLIFKVDPLYQGTLKK